ncbi:alpha/beta fold hydrolase [Kribbella sp. CA-253562]|uniref:alpha/beta fold hydrolase n=1 Tax=Kribbella sp. CA-253562 TaxID=3239942 RepID=UPI003D9260E3
MGSVDSAVIDEGSGEHAFVLLHGLGLDSGSWQPVAEVLRSAGVRVVRPDMRAHGRVDGDSSPYVLPELAADVIRTMDDLDVSQAHLVGHSLGGTVAAEVVLSYPSRVASVSVVDGLIAGLPASPVFVAWAEEVVGLAMQGLPELERRLPDTIMYKNRNGLRVESRLRDAAFVPASMASAYEAATAPVTSFDRFRNGEVAAPVLFIHGVEDPALDLSAGEVAALVPGARGVDVADAGHLSILEQPEAVAAAILDGRV